ncbi:MAG: hypothetical protein LBS00_07165 [Synergistaceae bacterium]|jgi:hypothetical protein|nr:hypothetical protein [Synergistaceae bacterium]
MAYRNRGTEEEYENYWNSGQNGNQEEYEKYLLIKSRLEGKTYRPPRGDEKGGERGNSLLSFYPRLKVVFVLLFFIYVTQILESYVKWGLTGRFLGDALYGGVLLSAMCWYFIKRDPGEGVIALIRQFLPNASISPSLPYWLFLVGCLFASLDPNDFKAWVRGMEHLSLALGVPVNCDAVLSLNLPRMPLLLKLASNLAVLFSGSLLLFEAVASRLSR